MKQTAVPVINEAALKREKVREVAEWMNEQFEAEGVLFQDVAASQIVEHFGEEFTYANNLGNVAIGKDVLAAFRKLTENRAIWSRSERRWRRREAHDDPNTRIEP